MDTLALLAVIAAFGIFIYLTRGGCLIALAVVAVVYLLIESSPIAFFILLAIVGSILVGLH